MMTIEQVRSLYTVDESGIVRSPGKFESEPAHVVAFWDACMNGAAGNEFYDGETQVTAITIDDDDAKAFPTLAEDIGKVALLWESDQGFVNCRIVTADDAAQIESACEASEDHDNESPPQVFNHYHPRNS